MSSCASGWVRCHSFGTRLTVCHASKSPAFTAHSASVHTERPCASSTPYHNGSSAVSSPASLSNSACLVMLMPPTIMSVPF